MSDVMKHSFQELKAQQKYLQIWHKICKYILINFLLSITEYNSSVHLQDILNAGLAVKPLG